MPLHGVAVFRQVFPNRNYLYYLGGNLISNSGNWAQRVAMGWLTWQLTNSTAWLGIIAFAGLEQIGFRLRPLKGDLAGFWSVTVSGKWHVNSRFENGHASDVDVTDYH